MLTLVPRVRCDTGGLGMKSHPATMMLKPTTITATGMRQFGDKMTSMIKTASMGVAIARM